MDTQIHFKLGFKLDEIFFGWHEGQLYQLPYTANGRFYALRLLRSKKTKQGWVYYHVRRKKVGLEKLKAMLKTVEWKINKPANISIIKHTKKKNNG